MQEKRKKRNEVCMCEKMKEIVKLIFNNVTHIAHSVIIQKSTYRICELHLDSLDTET